MPAFSHIEMDTCMHLLLLDNMCEGWLVRVHHFAVDTLGHVF